MLLPHQQNAGKNHNIKIAKRYFENVAQFRYLGTTITNQNLTQKEIKRRMNSGNACYHNLYSSPTVIRMIKSRKMRCAGHVARIEEKRNACRILVGKPEGKRPLGRPRINMDLREIGWDGMDWIDLAQDRDQ
jgi:hypothetical protein